MQCSKCRAEVNPQAQFCWQCGVPLSPAAPTSPPADQARSKRWAAVAAALALLLLLAGLLLPRLLRTRGPAVTTSPRELPETSAPPVTAAPPANTPQAEALTTRPAGNLPAGSGLPQGQTPPALPFAEDVAAYLRKLEMIQQRDAQNPMAQLFAMMATGLSGLTDALKGLTDETVGETSGNQTSGYLAQFDQLLQAKQALVRDFQAITPVPQPCQQLHTLYGHYLNTQVRAIYDLRNAVARADNLAAPLGVLPVGKQAEAAQQAASQEEKSIRRRYSIPRAAAPLVP
jgi:hypothetical protein